MEKDTQKNRRNYDSELRKEKRLRKLGTRNPSCRECQETTPFALTGTAPNILCQEHRNSKDGRSQVEAHHFAGKHNHSFTVPIPANDHRVLSELQNDWPIETLRNKRHSPLIAASAALRGWLDILRILIERVLGRIPPFLEQLDQYLTNKLGEQWWQDMESEREE
jgi:hypothetical protein